MNGGIVIPVVLLRPKFASSILPCLCAVFKKESTPLLCTSAVEISSQYDMEPCTLQYEYGYLQRSLSEYSRLAVLRARQRRPGCAALARSRCSYA